MSKRVAYRRGSWIDVAEVNCDRLFRMACWDEVTRWRRCGFTGIWLLSMVGIVLGEGLSLLPTT